jgi:hypothetical protein
MLSIRNCDAYWVWWYMPVIPVLRELRKGELKFETSLGYTVRPCQKKKGRKEEEEEEREREKERKRKFGCC